MNDLTVAADPPRDRPQLPPRRDHPRPRPQPERPTQRHPLARARGGPRQLRSKDAVVTDKPRIRIEPDWPQLAIALNATPEHVVALTRTTDRLERICDELQRLPVSTVVLTREEQQAIDRAISQLSPILDRLDSRLEAVADA